MVIKQNNNYSNKTTPLSITPSDTLVNNTPFTNGYNINDDDYNPNENENENVNDEIDSEATESETHSQTLSPLFQTKPNNNLNNVCTNLSKCHFKTCLRSRNCIFF